MELYVQHRAGRECVWERRKRGHSMAAAGEALRLYRALLREGTKFKNYNVRECVHARQKRDETIAVRRGGNRRLTVLGGGFDDEGTR